MKNYISKKTLNLSAAVVVGTLAGAESAHAGGGGDAAAFNTIGGNIIDGISQIPGLVTGIAYMLGILLAVLGILKIKDHVENPGQTPLQHGLIRLAAGGALFAVPIVTEAMDSLIDPDTATGAETAEVNEVVYGVAGGDGGGGGE